MIPITRLYELLLDIQGHVADKLDRSGFAFKHGYWMLDPLKAGGDGTKEGISIDHIILSPTESHIVKKLSDKKGICLAVKMPDADSSIDSPDSYSEQNHQLFYLLEKVSVTDFTDQTEREHYAKMQMLMKLIKKYLLARGLNGDACGGNETLSKPFRTEWEYQTYGGFNGLSISFDLLDFSL